MPAGISCQPSPVGPSSATCPLQAMSAEQKENLLLPNCTRHLHLHRAEEQLLSTCRDGSRASDQGRHRSAEAPHLVFQLHGGSTLLQFRCCC